MKSGISFFNAGFFKNNVKRFWPLWAAYFAVLYVTLPLMTLLDGGDAHDLLTTLSNFCGTTCTVGCFILAILTAMASFSFMYNSRSVGMISSMPVRREAVFTSAFLSGLLPVLAVNVIIAILTILPVGGRNMGIAAQSLLTWLGVWSLQFFIFYGIAVITAMMTGMLIALPILYGIFNFLIPGIELMVRMVLEVFTFGMENISTPVTVFCSPATFIIEHCSNVWYAATSSLVYDSGVVIKEPIVYPYWGTLIIYALVAAALVVIALLMFRRREMERTGDVVAVKRLRPVFKYGVTVCAALGLGILFYAIFSGFTSENNPVLLMSLTMIFGAFVGYFASDMLLKKSFHVFRGNWQGFGVMAVLCVVFVICCEADVFGIERYVPDEEDIKSITVGSGWEQYTVSSDFDELLELHGDIIANRKQYESRHGFFSNAGDIISFDYTLKNGRCVSRYYRIEYEYGTKDPIVERYMDIINRPDIVLARYTPSVAVTADHVIYANIWCNKWSEESGDYMTTDCSLTPEQMVELYYEAIIPDIKAGGYRSDREFDNTELQIILELSEDYINDPYGTSQLVINVDPNEPLTIQWIRENTGWDVYPDKK